MSQDDRHIRLWESAYCHAIYCCSINSQQAPEEIADRALREWLKRFSTPQSSDFSEIDDLNLPVRTWNALHNIGVRTVGQLCLIEENTLRRANGIGKRAIIDISKSLALIGRRLGDRTGMPPSAGVAETPSPALSNPE